MKERVVWYEPHPITQERKRELVGRGYKIIDARFAPPGWRGESDGTAEAATDPVAKHDDGYPSCDKLRAVIRSKTGKAPHWKASREKLIEQYEALINAPDR
mgnify:CR=1 FL=1